MIISFLEFCILINHSKERYVSYRFEIQLANVCFDDRQKYACVDTVYSFTTNCNTALHDVVWWLDFWCSFFS